MTLHDFIKKYIARNTMIRLWKEIEGYSHYMLTDDVVMEWEALNIRELSDVEVVHITDIVCDRNMEAVNIVVNTELTRDDIVKLFRNYEKRREEERRFVCEGAE